MIRGTKRKTEKKTDFALMAQIHNKWLVEVIDAETGEVRQRAKGLNVILDQWWDYPGNEISSIAVGKGSGTPSASDTALFSALGNVSTTSTLDLDHIKDGFISITFSAQLAPATYAGETLTEVGLNHRYTSGMYAYASLATHAMLTDMNGNPISIQKTATDIVNIYGTVFLHFDPGGFQDGNILLTDHPEILFKYIGGFFSTAYSGATMYFAKAAGRSGSTGTLDSTSFKSFGFDLTTKTATVLYNQVPVGNANISGGICMCLLGDSPDLNIRPRGQSMILSEPVGTGDGSTQNFKTKFDFANNATVYVDGVAQSSGVTVLPESATNYNNMYIYFRRMADYAAPGVLVASSKAESNRYTVEAGGTAIFEYLFHDLVPLTSLHFGYQDCAIYASDDLDTWTLIGTTASGALTVSIPAAYRSSRYWKFENGGAYGGSISGGVGENRNGYAIRFASAPAAGSVITVDYRTPLIPKDEEHLLDISVSLTIGAYTGEEI